ncbi:hypothetical protein [Acidilutibacter cellobiosedens]|uniref:hypothetical protein n=1 Tax=Acidilutibacter cellobiosedens TaxID=2507161 RepID=UPI001375C749|nr:hypothetical protein [Acidilutibacter cellobiosedens]
MVTCKGGGSTVIYGLPPLGTQTMQAEAPCQWQIGSEVIKNFIPKEIKGELILQT